MNNLWDLLKIQLLALLDINKIIYSKDSKAKKKFITFMFLRIAILFILGFVSFLYSFAMSYVFDTMNIIKLLPAIMMFAASFITLFTTIYKVNDILFSYKDYDIIMSLPIKTGYIIASRLLLLYIINLFFILVLLVPAMIAYGVRVSPSPYFYILSIITLFFIPLIPMIAATIIGTIITILSSKFRHSNYITIFLSIIAVIGIMLVSGKLGMVTTPELELLGEQIMDVISKVYPLVILYVNGICDQNLFYIIQFIILSFSAFLLYILIISKFYQRIHTILYSFHSKKNFVWKELKPSSAIFALYQKELRRYFSSANYVLNTIIGVVLMLLFSVMVSLVPSKQLELILDFPGLNSILNSMMPLISSIFIVLSCTTASSISLEGKSFGLLKSLPIHPRDIFLSKIMVNCTPAFPAIIINAILLTISLKLNLYTVFLLLITPIAYSLFMAELGLFMNLHFPVLNWMNEITVIKQSSATLFTLLIGFLSVAIPYVTVFLVSKTYCYLVMTAFVFLIIAFTLLLHYYLITKGGKILYSIDN